ncbi:PPOX class F420-dependent oxidoreductase [Actinoplanes derwentensis]|uniref:Pyridoxamine 5'-phosphate oxidase family protein n=1 Tax=Actinoplanes derwentensis TaxID=113562 RepID=A0A1H2DB56_9ACTN|nr:PPOX class F420-dependent oxidoreductase [Actinoplanes derwentensis]GID88516.1 PPOX class F420-dependent oxidoreductase [Actinoplanes derwentensis]SDT79953.1 pyridoxamine 5'-phosphate oxidase family protein [Actinoplanes derwentensis]
MTFTASELEYLAGQPLGRLATVQPDGTLQNNPVGFRWNAQTQTIDISGFRMAASRKFRNVAANGRVAFVVDDVPSVDPWRVRCVEIRGHGEAIDGPEPIIRIHPRRILTFGLDEPDREAHSLTVNKRDVSV